MGHGKYSVRTTPIITNNGEVDSRAYLDDWVVYSRCWEVCGIVSIVYHWGLWSASYSIASQNHISIFDPRSWKLFFPTSASQLLFFILSYLYTRTLFSSSFPLPILFNIYPFLCLYYSSFSLYPLLSTSYWITSPILYFYPSPLSTLPLLLSILIPLLLSFHLPLLLSIHLTLPLLLHTGGKSRNFTAVNSREIR